MGSTQPEVPRTCYLRVCVCVHIDIFIYMHVQVHIYLYTDVCTCRNVCVLCINTYADTYVYYVHIDLYKQN